MNSTENFKFAEIIMDIDSLVQFLFNGRLEAGTLSSIGLPIWTFYGPVKPEFATGPQVSVEIHCFKKDGICCVCVAVECDNGAYNTFTMPIIEWANKGSSLFLNFFK